MLRISRMADYAVVITSYIARYEKNTHSAAGVAESTGIPLPTTSKLLKLLAKNEILDSQRGVKGGFILSRPSRLISIAEIIESVDGPIAITDCLDGDRGCDLQKTCIVQEPWQRISAAISETLNNLTLENIIQVADSKKYINRFISLETAR